MPSDAFAERILRFIQAKGYKPQRLRELAEAMGIGEDERGNFHAACKALMKTGRVVLGGSSALTLPAPPSKLVGTFRSNPRGFGFVIPDTPNAHGDLYVPGRASGGALTGDTVVARVLKRGKRAEKMLYEGRVVSVVKRGQNRFVGELRKEFNRWFVVPDGNTLHVPVIVADPGAKGARPADQVVFEITQYPGERQEARGVILKVLGRRGAPNVDTLSIIEQHQLPGEFEEAVLQEAREATAAYDPRKEATGREDLRKLTVITIDPPDARDFDDAISLTRNREGSVELGVHIADVAHFVRPGGALDRAARERSNSIYLPRTVIPMLPEVLSNGVCSLQERQPRLAQSVFITYDRRGNVKRRRAAKTVIRSTKRLTYKQASAVLDGKRGRTSAKVVALLEDMEQLARKIRARRLRAGMLELDLPEIELCFDDEGKLVDVAPADTSFSHKIIEMFMVEANEAVSRLLSDRNMPHLRRIHEEPRDLSSGNLRRFIAALGHELPAEADRFAIQALLEETRGKDEAFPVHLAILRSMQRAEYAPRREGHYALASEDYCHFTSPIRRYPDLTVHRLVDAYVDGKLEKRGALKGLPAKEELTELGALCSANEQRAEAAERELKLVLVLRLLERHIGETFEGIVAGVANVGVFVQLQRFLIDGLLRFEHLIDDWWEVDAIHGCVVGQRTGHQITIGDRLEVVISRIHIPTRRMEVALAEPLKETKVKGRKAAHAGTLPAGQSKRKRKRATRVPRPSAAATKRRTRKPGKSSQRPT